MKKFLVSMSAMLGLLLVACAKEEEPTSFVHIDPAIQSRVTALNFEPNDCIGLRIVRGTEQYAENAALTYDGESFHSSSLLWYGNSDDASTLTAYYPFQAQGFPTEWSVAADQSGGYTSSDLLGAVKQGVTPTSSAVKMTFRHLMARLQTTVQHASDEPIRSVALGGLIATATLDWETVTATAQNGASTSEIITTLEEGAYVAILVPQKGTIELVVTTDKQRYTKQIEAEFLGGKSYKLTVKIEQEQLSVVLSGEIDDWEEGGEIGGEPTPPNDEEEEEEEEEDTPSDPESISWHGESYSTRTIGGKVWFAENLRYLPTGATLGEGVWYPSGNEANQATLGLLYNYATATTANLCPEGWHLPSKAELELLTANDCGADFFTPAGMAKPNEGDLPSYPTANNYLISSSPEGDDCYALKFTEEAGIEVTKVRKINGYSVRCVRD